MESLRQVLELPWDSGTNDFTEGICTRVTSSHLPVIADDRPALQNGVSPRGVILRGLKALGIELFLPLKFPNLRCMDREH